MVCERIVLFRVQYFKQSTGWVAPEISSDFIQLIEHEHRVLALDFSHLLQDSARQGAYICSAMPANIGFVSYSAK